MTPSLQKEQYLAGKVAIVTGAAKHNGIGFVTALALAEHGANVVISYLTSAGPADRAARMIQDLGVKAIAVQADLGTPESGRLLVDAALKYFDTKTIDIIVNNAAVANPMSSFESMTIESFADEYNVNVRGPQLLIQAALPYMQHGGRIINISTIVSKIGSRYLLNYAGSKGAMNTLASSLAEELAPKGITVNTVAPGPVNTDAVATVPDTHPLYQRLNSRQADKRYGEPKEIAEVVLFFASPMSSYVNGQILYVDGGIAGL